MHVDKCPRCGAAGYIVRTYRKIHGKTYGPYPVVQHYVSKSKTGATQIRLCFISLKKLHPTEEARISKLLARAKTEGLI